MQPAEAEQANPASTPCHSDPLPTAPAWDHENRRFLRNLEIIDDHMKKLTPGHLQDDAHVALEAADAAFKKHMNTQPGAAAATPTGGKNSSSSSSTTANSQTGSRFSFKSRTLTTRSDDSRPDWDMKPDTFERTFGIVISYMKPKTIEKKEIKVFPSQSKPFHRDA